MRDFHQPRRSAVIARRGAVATSHYLSSAAALEVLKSGGNALDAAITAAAMQGVVEPQMTGVGGDLFALISFPDGRIEGYNASGRAARNIDPEKLRAQGLTAIPDQSGLAVTVPSGVAGWCRLLEKHGTIGIDRALAPAIDIAENGYAVSPRVAFDWIVANYDRLAPQLPEAWRGGLAMMASGLCDAAAREETRAFFEPRLQGVAQGPIRLEQTLDSIDRCIARRQAQLGKVSEFLRAY